MQRGGEDALLGGFRVSRRHRSAPEELARRAAPRVRSINQPVNSTSVRSVELVGVRSSRFRHVCIRADASSLRSGVRTPVGDARRDLHGARRHHDRQHDPQRRVADDRARARRDRVAAPMDRRLLRDRVRVPAADGRRAGRQVRAQGRADVRRRAVRRVLRAGVVRDLARPAHRLPRAHGHRRRADLPDHAVDPHQHVHRSRACTRDRHLGRHLGSRHRDRPARRRVPRRALLVGRGVPRERAGLHRRVHRRRDLRADVA